MPLRRLACADVAGCGFDNTFLNFTLRFGQVNWINKVPLRRLACADVAGCGFDNTFLNFTLRFGQVNWINKVPLRRLACADVAGCGFDNTFLNFTLRFGQVGWINSVYYFLSPCFLSSPQRPGSLPFGFTIRKPVSYASTIGENIPFSNQPPKR